MKTRNITLTLDKAREWYYSGSVELREVALQAYTKEELTIPEYTKIKTFEDACKALGLNMNFVNFTLCNMKNIEGGFGKHLTAIYKIDIIRKALNGDWKPSLVEGKLYYPFIRFYPANKAKNIAAMNGRKIGPSFIADSKEYTLVGKCASSDGEGGLAKFSENCEYGVVRSNKGLLGCKSKAIAEHMSRYFMKEIFEASFTQHIGTYTWV